ncbi:hypothetical protein CC80DRAFT_553619 [Byssothecium circinans]|uniref:Uncharacterized protein n=1 Tax=Byssothecium circinans TaxID=147558 RepID=A0A6A5TGE3_9PLEO|nr:hypothetical protein CC80DRAFT_553619 [Byssothecium circinans]
MLAVTFSRVTKDLYESEQSLRDHVTRFFYQERLWLPSPLVSRADIEKMASALVDNGIATIQHPAAQASPHTPYNIHAGVNHGMDQSALRGALGSQSGGGECNHSPSVYQMRRLPRHDTGSFLCKLRICIEFHVVLTKTQLPWYLEFDAADTLNLEVSQAVLDTERTNST